MHTGRQLECSVRLSLIIMLVTNAYTERFGSDHCLSTSTQIAQQMRKHSNKLQLIEMSLCTVSPAAPPPTTWICMSWGLSRCTYYFFALLLPLVVLHVVFVSLFYHTLSLCLVASYYSILIFHLAIVPCCCQTLKHLSKFFQKTN